MRSLLASVLFAAFLQPAEAQNTRAWEVGQTVNTTSGLVTGRPAVLPGDEQVSEYLGIPYAAPPVGDLRWAAPQPFKTGGPVTAIKWVRYKHNHLWHY
jgi:hypothetical protein